MLLENTTNRNTCSVYHLLSYWKPVKLKKLDSSNSSLTVIPILSWTDDLFLVLLWRDLGSAPGPSFPCPWVSMLAFRLECSTTVIPTSKKVLSNWKLVELYMLDFSGRTRTSISILKSAAEDKTRVLTPENPRSRISSCVPEQPCWLDCSTAALTLLQKVLSNWKLAKLKMLDFCDHTITGISILTSAAD